MSRSSIFASLAATALLACEAPRTGPLCEPEAACPASAGTGARCVVEARLYGRTATADGHCSASSASACRASLVTCGVWGQCAMPTAPNTMACGWSADDRDVRAARDPACAGHATCVATSDADCQASRGCLLEGRCRARAGICVAAAADDCKAGALCGAIGWCTSTAAGLCRAGGIADCEQADACRSGGQCGVADGHCVACADSEGCRADGRCERVESSCRATRPEHCEKSEACKRRGLCKAFQGTCTR